MPSSCLHEGNVLQDITGTGLHQNSANVSVLAGPQSAAAFHQALRRIGLYQTPLQSLRHIIGPYQTALVSNLKALPLNLVSGPAVTKTSGDAQPVAQY